MDKKRFPKLQSIILIVVFILYLIKDRNKMIMGLVIMLFVYICAIILRDLYNRSIKGR